jgi:RNA polymerase sigma factor (sigma-70 family)
MGDDRGRIEDLYMRHAPAVTAYALRRTDRATAEEVVGEVFLIAWRRRDAIGDDELAWLLEAARRVLANARRGRVRQVALQQRIAAQPPEWVVDPPERDWPVLRALAALSDRDREAILLVAWDELDAGRAARVLGVRRRTFEARLYRARRRLATALSEAPATAATVNDVVKERG